MSADLTTPQGQLTYMMLSASSDNSSQELSKDSILGLGLALGIPTGCFIILVLYCIVEDYIRRKKKKRTTLIQVPPEIIQP